MKHKSFIILLLALFALVSCTGEPHFLKNADYRKRVVEQFEKRRIQAENRAEALFSVFEKPDITTEQKEALQFLYAYMPISDLADYDGDFFLNQVDMALRARDTFSWGRSVPDDIFRHFVLVYRVNNENLDSARTVFFNELKDRVKNLSMYDAALEVNHWCHEKVCYRGTDARTSAPLALVRTSWGRCGEESTFTVTALRSVGIPARQVYTPRWVHTDDNHAWVEVWVDGKWYFMGACEPEAELNAGWFAGPAKRAMMLHTNVFGYYEGREEKNLETPLYSKINVLENYAETRKVKVAVVDENGNPADSAKVEFLVYNYAEFYPISTNTADENGRTSIISGKGDLLVWASKDGKFGYAKSGIDDSLTVVKITDNKNKLYSETLVMNVPPDIPTKGIASEKAEQNGQRLAQEDSIRNAYMKTFISEEESNRFADKLRLDKGKVWQYLNRAQGNFSEIQNFIEKNKDNNNLFPLLETLTEKDLRDTPAEYLQDFLGDAGFVSPRINIELIRPWKTFLEKAFDNSANAESIIKYVKENIKLTDENYYGCPLSPRGVYELGISDVRSRNTFFVAACRSNNIQARMESSTNRPQYLDDGTWTDAVLDTAKTTVANLPKGKLTLTNSSDNAITPSYYRHYTLAYFRDGRFHTLDLNWLSFPATIDLDEGYYRLMAGNRADDGSVTVAMQYFEIKKNAEQTVVVKLPEIEQKLLVKGTIDMNTTVVLNGGATTSLKELSNGKGLFLCFVDPGKEPSKHILQDLPAAAKPLEEWGGGALLVIPDSKNNEGFDVSAFKGLPAQTVWSVDSGDLLKTATAALNLDVDDNFPFSLYLTDDGGIVFSSVGYRIGIGEEIVKIISLAKK